MKEMVSKYAVIVAGGQGSRMNAAVPKQFLELNGKSLICHSIDAFLLAYPDVKIVLVLPEAFQHPESQHFLAAYPSKAIQVTCGGHTRFQSVKNGLSLIEEDGIVFVHDAVRCLLTPDLIKRCYETALEKGSAIPAVSSKDSIRMVTDKGNQSIDRNTIKLIQTPQTFNVGLIKRAFEQPFNVGFTDEASVMEAAGHEVFLVEGESTNIKVTLPVDLIIAAKILEERVAGR